MLLHSIELKRSRATTTKSFGLSLQCLQLNSNSPIPTQNNHSGWPSRKRYSTTKQDAGTTHTAAVVFGGKSTR